MQQNCQITRCARQHTMDSVLKSAAVAVFRLALKRVWLEIRDSRNGGHCLLTVGGRLRGVKIGAECVKYAWLSCPARPSRWVLCISMQWLRLKGCHVACDECASGEICSHQHMWVTGSVIWAVASGASLKFGVQGASATNWFSRVNGARDNGIRLYYLNLCALSPILNTSANSCRRGLTLLCFKWQTFNMCITKGSNYLKYMHR